MGFVCTRYENVGTLANACFLNRLLFNNNGPNGIYFPSVATSWLWGEACCVLLYCPTGAFFSHCTYVPILNFDYLGECSHWGNRGIGGVTHFGWKPPLTNPATPLVNEAPPMPISILYLDHFMMPCYINVTFLRYLFCLLKFQNWQFAVNM